MIKEARFSFKEWLKYRFETAERGQVSGAIMVVIAAAGVFAVVASQGAAHL